MWEQRSRAGGVYIRSKQAGGCSLMSDNTLRCGEALHLPSSAAAILPMAGLRALCIADRRPLLVHWRFSPNRRTGLDGVAGKDRNHLQPGSSLHAVANPSPDPRPRQEGGISGCSPTSYLSVAPFRLHFSLPTGFPGKRKGTDVSFRLATLPPNLLRSAIATRSFFSRLLGLLALSNPDRAIPLSVNILPSVS